MDTRFGGGGIRLEPVECVCAYCGSSWYEHEAAWQTRKDDQGRWFCYLGCQEDFARENAE